MNPIFAPFEFLLDGETETYPSVSNKPRNRLDALFFEQFKSLYGIILLNAFFPTSKPQNSRNFCKDLFEIVKLLALLFRF